MGIERLTTLAFSMYANKKAYALLLGSGISRPAHIPSGWDVEIELIKKLAATKEVVNEKDWHQWFKDFYGVSASYSFLLEKLVKTPTERVNLMRDFFEPNEDEKKLGWKQPTKAHKAIAQLVKEGYISVILTTNLDLLLEHSLEAEGITPQVISHESDIEKATPLPHSKTVTIVKINGDYTSCNFRNTTKELEEYPESMTKYLSRIFEDYGLITCGWSAKYDKGLVDIIKNSPSSRYNSFFTHIGESNDDLKALATSRNGETMKTSNADDLFSELYQQVMALEKMDVSRSISHDIMLSRVKKFLSSDLYRIEYSDLIEKLGKEAYEKIITKVNNNFTITSDQFPSYLEWLHNTVKPLTDTAILAVRWGKSFHIELFGNILVKLCRRPFQNGEIASKHTKYLHSLGATLLFNAIGVASVKYERFSELNKLLERRVPGDHFMGYRRESLFYLLSNLDWDYEDIQRWTGWNYLYPQSIILFENLHRYFNDIFIADSEYENMFYMWEQLMSLLYGYMKTKPIIFRVPTGQFLHQKNEYFQHHNADEPFTIFFNSADKLKDEWEPIKQGMFGGSYNNYKEISEKAKKFYSDHFRYN